MILSHISLMPNDQTQISNQRQRLNDQTNYSVVGIETLGFDLSFRFGHLALLLDG
jgi:hypothetical protein